MTASQRRQGLLFIMVGPPGVGKNALMNKVLSDLKDLRQFPTATTRPMRPTEQQGREHLFVNREEFQKLIRDHALLEWQIVHDELYGMPRATIEEAIDKEQDLIADIDVLGATHLRSVYPDNTVLIFIRPPDLEELKRRMKRRGETEESIAKRLRRVDMEMQYAPLCDYLITNDNLDEASAVLHAIILAERSRRALLNLRVEYHLPRHKFAYFTMVLPICGDAVLRRDESPHFPMAQMTHGEFPHDSALRALRQEFTFNPSSEYLYHDTWTGALILPAALETERLDHFQQLTFIYLYLMPERIAPPEGWCWTPYLQAGLSTSVIAAIRHALSETPSSDGKVQNEPA